MAMFDSSTLKDGVSAKEVWGWALFDAANSGYSTVVLTAVFNAYFVSTVCRDASWATLLWTCAVAFSNFLAIVFMPAIARISDATAKKKIWLLAATLLCIAATAMLSFAREGTLLLAFSMVVLSNFGFSVGETLNSAFLPELARPTALGKVSGWGWSLGYAGGLLTLALCLAVVMRGQSAGLSESTLVPVTNLITAGVFLVLSLPFFLWVKERAVPRPSVSAAKSAARRGIRKQLFGSLKTLRSYPDFACLALCGFLYQCGIATVIALSAIYASEVMGFTMTETLTLVLLVNITAAVGAFGFGYLQDWLGHKRSLMLTLLVWVAMVVTAWAATNAATFWVSANLAGLAMGSSQSAGRAMVAVLSPKARSAEFYGLWNMALWVSAMVGPLTYGTVTWVTGNDQRLAIAVTGLFFVAAVFALMPLDLSRGSALAEKDGGEIAA
jgi:UMF1 family MFS transporter